MIAAFTKVVFFGRGSANVMPESIHDPAIPLMLTVVSNSITFVFQELPPIMAACVSDQGKRRGATPGGQRSDWNANTP
jgi:hypothetical protein